MSINDASIIAVCRASTIARACGRAGDRLAASYRSSRIAQLLAPVLSPAAVSRDQRRRSVGVCLLTAAAIHVLLLLTRGLPDWRAIVIPAIAAVQGMLLVAMAGPADHDE